SRPPGGLGATLVERPRACLPRLDPPDRGFSRNPCALPSGERRGRGHDLLFRVPPASASGHPLGHFAIPDGPEPVRIRRDPGREQRPHFSVPPRVQHPPNSRRDPSIEVVARRPDAELDETPPRRPLAPVPPPRGSPDAG